MIYSEPDDQFICTNCGKLMAEHYRSTYNTEICVFCDTEGDYDEDYPEDDSESSWNE